MSNQITRWNPFREMAAMQSAMDRLFEETWRPFFTEGVMAANNLSLDVHEDDSAYLVTTDLPGVASEHVHVSLDGDYLVIEAEIPEQVIEKEGQRSLIQERRYGRFSRRVRLPHPVDNEKVEAHLENGVLKLTLPKSGAVKPKMIPVKVGNHK